MPDPDYTDLEGYIPPKVKAAAVAGRDALAQSAGQAATRGDAATVEGLKDAATMVPGGVLDNWDEELLGILGGIGEAIGRPFEHPSKTVPKGYRDASNAQKLRKAVAMERSPVMGSVGYGAGAAAQTAVAGPLLKGVAGVGGKLARLATGTEKAAEGANMLRRGAVATGNAALPGAITGAGSAESIEDIPEAAGMGALIGTAATGAAAAPGAIRRMVGSERYVGKPAAEFALDARLRAGGRNKGQITKLAQRPGGKRAVIDRETELGIGTDWIPTNQSIEEQATEVAEKLQAQNQALADQAAHLTIPREEVATEIERRIPSFASDGDAPVIRRLGQEAKRFKSGGEKTFPELTRDRSAYHSNAFKSQTDTGQRAKREVGAAINDILERRANELPGEIGTPWREGNRKLSTAIEARDMANAGQGGGNLGKGMKFGGAIAGAMTGTPGVLAGIVGTVPGVQMRAAQGLAAVSRAAQREPTSTLAKVLMRASPSAQTLGRVAVAAQAQQGVEAVREAALQGDEEAVSEHYRQMLTNPEYNREAVKEE